LFALILESLGSTELLFILVVALMFFGPRKLPQLSRSLGKSLAEFRKASEDFKRTWEREVELESYRAQEGDNGNAGDSSLGLPPPSISPASANHVVARDSVQTEVDAFAPSDASLAAEASAATTDTSTAEPLSKRDWL
jgi:TatA/E family protein of Tat protein translocase